MLVRRDGDVKPAEARSRRDPVVAKRRPGS
jgi:hypothetical protein